MESNIQEGACKTTSENITSPSLSKYFNQNAATEDIFDTIVKPLQSEATKHNAGSLQSLQTPAKEDTKVSTSFTLKKDEEELKIFTYFSQSAIKPNSSKDLFASEFFDQISQKASERHAPVVITNKLPCEQQVDKPILENTLIEEPTKETLTTEISQQSNINSSTPNISSAYAPTASTAVNLNCPTTLGFLLPSIPQVTPIPIQTSATAPATSYSSSSPEVPWDVRREKASGWWIPCTAVQQWMNQLRSSQPVGEYETISPSLSNSVELTDPIQELLRRFDGDAAAANRQVLTANSVSQDDQGIVKLIENGCWRAAINLCGRLLTAYGQGHGKTGLPVKHSPHSLQLWFTRLALLVKCQLLDVASAEMAAFGNLDTPDLYMDFYPDLYGNKRGTMVPFSFRLLVAEWLLHCNKVNEAQENLCLLLSTTRQIIREIDCFLDPSSTSEDKKEALNLWAERENRVVHSLVNCALIKKDFYNAVRLLQRQLQMENGNKADLYSILGRVFLQLGDVQRAQQAFNSATDNRDSKLVKNRIATIVDTALIAIAQNSFSEAYGYFQQARALDPDNPLLLNNAACTLLYMGKMQESMMLLEESLGTKPDTMLHNPTVLNVCTLYELESSLTLQRKLGMLRLASHWRSDNLNVSSFKFQP